MRNRYIDNMELELALKKYFQKIEIKRKIEKINVEESVGRVTSEGVYAEKSSPHYNSSAMDGIAVNSKSLETATESNPVILNKNEYIYVNTGNPIPREYDAVIMIEEVIELGEGKVQLNNSTYPWKYIRNIGEDIVRSEMILPSNHKIRALDIGSLIAGGTRELYVYKKPRLGVVPTGTEIVTDIASQELGKIVDSNSYMLSELGKEYGAIYNRYSPVKDDYNNLRDKIKKYIEENDILVINAGSSAGTEDYTRKIIEELGEVVVHGIGIKPGKPTILGIINKKPVIGVPGYPVSSYISFENFVKPIILELSGEVKSKKLIKGIVSKRINSSLKHKEFIRVNIGIVEGKPVVTPISNGAGVTISLVKADGIGIVPRNVEGIEAGEEIEIELLKDFEEIKNTLVITGSDDIVIDIIGDMTKVSSAHVGSMGGILSMRKKECHIAPIHLLDGTTGEYNIPYIKKYFKDEKLALIKGIKREQGFIVEKGNPLGIKTIKDLLREDILFLNRQRGSGTRILLDYLLEKENIDSENIKGYDLEYNTHMDIAEGVKSGNGNIGIGIKSVAEILGLDFIKLSEEEYDFLIYENYLEDIKVKKFLEVLESKEFKKRIENIPGYTLKDTAKIIKDI